MSHTFESPASMSSVLNNYLRMSGAGIDAIKRSKAEATDRTLMDAEPTGIAERAGSKRGAASMVMSGGRTLMAFGGARAGPVVAAPEAKRSRGIGSSPVAAFDNLEENLVATYDAIDADNAIDDLEKWCIKLYLLTPFNLFPLLNFAARNLWVPVNAILFRCATFGMQTVLKVAAGKCGKQFTAFNSFRWNIDGLLGVLRGQLDYFYAAKVTDTRLVFQADNFHFDRYYGGLGAKPVGHNNVTPTSSNADIFSARPSVYVALEPYSRQDYDDVLSITGRKRDIGKRMGANLSILALTFLGSSTGSSLTNNFYRLISYFTHQVSPSTTTTSSTTPTQCSTTSATATRRRCSRAARLTTPSGRVARQCWLTAACTRCTTRSTRRSPRPCPERATSPTSGLVRASRRCSTAH